MTSADRLAPILDFRTDTDDPITDDHVHNHLLTHPVKGIFINGNLSHDEIASFLDFCHPTPVPIALVNHPPNLYYWLYEHVPQEAGKHPPELGTPESRTTCAHRDRSSINLCMSLYLRQGPA